MKKRNVPSSERSTTGLTAEMARERFSDPPSCARVNSDWCPRNAEARRRRLRSPWMNFGIAWVPGVA